MKIVSATHSTNPHYNGGCDYGLVDITPKLARRIRDRMKSLLALAAADADLHEAHYWDDHAEYLGLKAADVSQELEESLLAAEDGYMRVDESAAVPPEAVERTEYRHMVIAIVGAAAEVYWRASPKNDSIYVETNPLPQSLIEEVAAGGVGE